MKIFRDNVIRILGYLVKWSIVLYGTVSNPLENNLHVPRQFSNRTSLSKYLVQLSFSLLLPDYLLYYLEMVCRITIRINMSLVFQFSILGKCVHFFRKMVDTIFKTLSWEICDSYVHTCTKHSQSGLSCSKVDSTIHRINLYPLDRAIRFPNAYSLNSDLSSG